MPKGRKPKPSALKSLQGNPGKRPLNDQAMRAPAGWPEPPTDLSPELKAQWDRTGALVAATGVLTTLDGYALLILASAAADYLNLRAKAPPGSDVLASAQGKLYWNPFAAARDKAEARLLRMISEFGLTPVSREKVKGQGQADEADPFELLLSGGASVQN